MDLAQITLMIAACYGCYQKGISKGVGYTLDFFEEQGIIEKEQEKEQEKIN
jgi:hypothetical protein